MRTRFLLVCLTALLLSACAPRTFGPSAATLTPGTAAGLESGKSVFVAVAAPAPQNLEDDPGRIATEIAVHTKGYAAVALPAAGALPREEALAQARAHNADYLFFAAVREWYSPGFTKFGSSAKLRIEVIDTATDTVLLTGNIEARCMAALMGMEQSAPACFSEHYREWLNAVYARAR